MNHTLNGIPHQVLEALRRFDSCTLSNAIEVLNVRPRNEGYMHGNMSSCIFPALPPAIGYAVTGGCDRPRRRAAADFGGYGIRSGRRGMAYIARGNRNVELTCLLSDNGAETLELSRK